MKAKMSKKLTAKTSLSSFEVILYPENEAFSLVSDSSKFSEFLDLLRAEYHIRDVAAILHDKDKDKNGEIIGPHVHFLGKCVTGYTMTPLRLCRLFGFPDDDFHQIGRIRGGWPSAVSYLVHANAPEKYQYPLEAVVGSVDVAREVETARRKSASLDLSVSSCAEYAARIESGAVPSWSWDSPRYGLTAFQIAKWGNTLAKVAQIVAKRNALALDRLLVGYIYGPGGSGKSSLAELVALNMLKNFAADWDCLPDLSSVYRSANSSDPFGLYAGQPVVILDDLRPEIFNFAGLLSLLDNYHKGAPVASRYCDKLLSAHVVLITSTLSPSDFLARVKNLDEFRVQFDRGVPALSISGPQFFRRLSCVYEVFPGYTPGVGYYSSFVYDLDNKKFIPAHDKNGDSVARVRFTFGDQ